MDVDVVAPVSARNQMGAAVAAADGPGADAGVAEARRRAPIRLLGDLVEHGLYRIDHEALAEGLIDRCGVDWAGG